MAGIRFRVRGDKQLARKFGAIPGFTERELSIAMVEQAENIIGDAKEITPVDTGALRASGHVTKPEMTGKGPVVGMGFGGPSVDYALAVHERTDVRHEVGGPKFLERAIQKRAPRLAGAFRAALDQAIRRRFGAR